MAVIPPRCKRCQTCHWIRDGCPTPEATSTEAVVTDALNRKRYEGPAHRNPYINPQRIELTPPSDDELLMVAEIMAEQELQRPATPLSALVQQQMAPAPKAGFDKASYMRDYMRRYRRGERKTRPNHD